MSIPCSGIGQIVIVASFNIVPTFYIRVIGTVVIHHKISLEFQFDLFILLSLKKKLNL